MSVGDLPFVSIIVPTLNEERYIAQCLRSLLEQGLQWADGSAFEILVMDGGSTDRTRSIVEALATECPHLQLIENPKRLQSAAMNLAAQIASPRATVLLRADGHISYPANFLSFCVEALRERDVQSVVVPMIAGGVAGFQRAVAAVQNSILGNGGAAHRRKSASRYVDHGHHAAFDRAFFLQIGGYDETFSHNEDAEYDYRVLQAGGRVWLCGDVVLTYFPRPTPLALARQYYRHGSGRARTLLTHRLKPRLRQMVPPAMLIGCVGSLVLAILVHPALAGVPALYLLVLFGYSAIGAVRQRDRWLLAAGLIAIIMHASWGAGFIATCFRYGLLGSSTHMIGTQSKMVYRPASRSHHSLYDA